MPVARSYRRIFHPLDSPSLPVWGRNGNPTLDWIAGPDIWVSRLVVRSSVRFPWDVLVHCSTALAGAVARAPSLAGPRSSGDRAPPSGGGSAGSNPAGGASVLRSQTCFDLHGDQRSTATERNANSLRCNP